MKIWIKFSFSFIVMYFTDARGSGTMCSTGHDTHFSFSQEAHVTCCVIGVTRKAQETCPRPVLLPFFGSPLRLSAM